MTKTGMSSFIELDQTIREGITPYLSKGETPIICFNTDMGLITKIHIITNSRLLHASVMKVPFSNRSLPPDGVSSIRLEEIAETRFVGGNCLDVSGPGSNNRIACVFNSKDLMRQFSSALQTAIENTKNPMSTKAESTDGFLSMLERLSVLHSNGELTEEEFKAAKAKLLK